jgi:predicted ester cyclase
MSQSPRDLAIRWFEEVWNKGRLEAVDELATPDAKSYGFPQPESVLNREEFKEYVLEFRRSFTHVHLSVDETVAEGYRVAVRWTGTMKHTGSGLGFAPTGRLVHVHGMSMMHLRDGLISAGWNALDLGSVVHFLSAISASPQPYRP